MTEYWLMFFCVSLGATFAWVFFRRLAKVAIWSQRPKLDALRYSLITGCLAIEVGNTFEIWEAAILGIVSLVAYLVIRHDRELFESAMRDLANQNQRFSTRRMEDR